MFGKLEQSREHAYEEFHRLHNQATRGKFWSLLTGHRNALLTLDAATKQQRAHNASHRGVQTVPIAQIRGSEGRSHDFDADFRPLKEESKERWINIAVAHQRQETLPAVDLIKVDDIYFVRDGHHRISVARMIGQQEIDANVITWSN